MMKISDLSSAQILVMGYFIVIITGTILLMLPIATSGSQGLNFVDALFTATSATCVTGLIVVNTAAVFSVFGQVVIMVLIQIGGLGIMTMSTMAGLILGRRISYKERLIIQDDLQEFSISNVIHLVKYVITFTVVIQGAGALLFFVRLVTRYEPLRALYFSVFHAVSAFNNAGFDIFGNSLESFTGDFIINFVVMGLIIMGGLGFVVLVELYRTKDWKRLRNFSLQTKIVLLVSFLLLVIGFFMILLLEFDNSATMEDLSWGHKIISSLFLSVTPRTAGFNTLPTGDLRVSTLFFVILLMFIGASPGSTGGGIKTTTFGAMMMSTWNLIKGRSKVEIFKREVNLEVIEKAFAITLLAAMLVITVTMVLVVNEGLPFVDILFESVSAFGTVGLSTGVTPQLSNLGRILITMTMFAGRVGPLTLAIAFAKRRQKGIYHYPREDIMVG